MTRLSVYIYACVNCRLCSQPSSGLNELGLSWFSFFVVVRFQFFTLFVQNITSVTASYSDTEARDTSAYEHVTLRKHS